MAENKRPPTEEEARRIRLYAQVTIGLNYLREGRNEEALRTFDDVLKEDAAESRAQMGRGLALARLGRFDEALAIAEAILKADPTNARAFSTRATAHEYAGRLEAARADFERAIALEPEGAMHRYNFACYWAKRDDAERCREQLAEALRLDPGSNVFAATDVDIARFRDEDWFQELVAFKK
jgi:Flp pilus assembly protein TadD